jgi:tubulin polyglutamylase TTLL9
MSKYGIVKTDKAFIQIQEAIIRSLQGVQSLVAQDKRCFELYGYDFLFDSNMKTWLI